MNHRLLIKNAQVITLDDELGDFSKASILIENDTITAIGPDLDVVDGEIIDATDMIAMPGFVDTHRHVWQGQIRGTTTDLTLGQYMQWMHGVLGDRQSPSIGAVYRPQDVYAGNLLGAVEAIDAGITTLLDWSHIMNSPENADAAIRALQDSGIRAVFAHGFSQLSGHLLTDVERVKTQYFASETGLLTMALAIRGPEMSSMAEVRQEIERARNLGLRISMHVIGGAVKPIELLAAHDLLGPDLNFAHCNALTDYEFALIKDTGGSISITPEVEMQMGMGFPATGKALWHGISPSLGVDIVTATGGDLFSQMKIALQTERARQNDEQLRKGQMPETLSLTTRQALEWATINGAKALGMDHRTGSLTPGKQADLILIRTTAPNLSPVNNPVGSVVLQSHAGNVDSVFVGGKALKRNGRLVHADWQKLRELAIESRDYIAANSHNQLLTQLTSNLVVG
ncbi:amidohydrolase family protein [Spirosoma fluminis]